VRDRELLSIGQIQEQFYPDLSIEPAQFAAVWRDVSEAFCVPEGLLRPSDRFGVELPYWVRSGTTDEDLDLSFALKRRLKGSKRGALPEIKLVDDYVRYVIVELASA
jgi:hypothetical protein